MRTRHVLWEGERSALVHTLRRIYAREGLGLYNPNTYGLGDTGTYLVLDACRSARPVAYDHHGRRASNPVGSCVIW